MCTKIRSLKVGTVLLCTALFLGVTSVASSAAGFSSMITQDNGGIRKADLGKVFKTITEEGREGAVIAAVHHGQPGLFPKGIIFTEFTAEVYQRLKSGDMRIRACHKDEMAMGIQAYRWDNNGHMDIKEMNRTCHDDKSEHWLEYRETINGVEHWHPWFSFYCANAFTRDFSQKSIDANAAALAVSAPTIVVQQPAAQCNDSTYMDYTHGFGSSVFNDTRRLQSVTLNKTCKRGR